MEGTYIVPFVRGNSQVQVSYRAAVTKLGPISADGLTGQRAQHRVRA